MTARTLLPGLALLICMSTADVALAASFTVSSTGDGGDAAPGNGVCATGGGACTLRAAVQEANALAGADSATVPVGTIALGSSLTITAPLTITGAGSQSGQTVIDAGGHQGFFVDADGVALRHLAVGHGDAGGGGGIQVGAGQTLEIADARLFENNATTGGGAIAIDENATVTVLRTTMEDNTAVGAFGGAVWNAGTLFVEESLFADNQSLRAGAIRNVGGAVLNLRNSTVSGNSVDPQHERGGRRDRDGGDSFAFLNSATIYDNHGEGETAGNIAGGGIYTSDDSTTVAKNSIIAGNDDPFGPDDCVGPVSSDSRYNLLEDTAGCGLPAVTSTWVLGEDPELGALQNNGGPTRSRLPGPTSPVIDAGYPFPPGGPAADSCEATDQRGVQRLLCDIGAVEREVSVPAQLTVNSTTDAVDALPGNASCSTAGGSCSLRAAVMEANRLPGVQTINVSAGTHGFTIAPSEGGFEPAAGGDLDLTDEVVVQAQGGTSPIVDANDLSRVFEVSPGTTATIRGLALRDGSDSSGGGVRVTSGELTLDDTTVSSNVASVAGGGVATEGLDEVLTITDSTIRNNVASFSGGGGIEAGGELAVSDSVVRHNTSGGSGGGIRVGDTATITGSTVRNNTTTGGLGNGGGVSGNGLTIDSSTVSANTAQTQGGGVFGTGTIINSTLSGNATSTNGGGASTNGALVLANTTVADNTAAIGGRGLHRFGSSSQLVVLNTILANPGGTECAGGSPTSLGHNIASDGTCSLAAAGDLPETNALIDPLGYYGGPTRTHRLQVGSPALDAASVIGLATDQRGVARPIGPAPDVGAVEGTGISPSPFISASLLSLLPLLGDTLTVRLPQGIVAGDLLVVGVTSRSRRAVVPAGWRVAARTRDRGATQLVLWRVATGGEGRELAVRVGSGARATASALRIGDQAGRRPLLAAATSAGRGDLATGALTVPAGALVVALQAWTGPRGDTRATPPRGWTEVADGVDGSGRVQTSVASFTAPTGGRLRAAVRLSHEGRWSMVLLAIGGNRR